MVAHRNLVCFLGKPTLYEAGASRSFGGPRRAIALLAYLVQHRNETLSREALAEQFWPDDDPETARSALRRHLYRALSALPGGDAATPWALGDKRMIRWNPDAPIDVDVVRYEALVAAGEFENAVELYRGDYLEDFYDDWILAERERLRHVHAATLATLIEARRKSLDYAEAVGFAQMLAAIEPLREDAIRRLMSLRFAMGDRSGALADFETFRRRLRDELDADPMPETVALREAIVSGAVNTLESIATISVQSARSGFPFVGRERELHTLRERWDRAARGQTGVVLVSGEAGTGKSRLIAELLALVEAQGGRSLVGTTAPVEAEPYQPVAEALRYGAPILQATGLDEPTKIALSVLLPTIAALLGESSSFIAVEPERDRRRLFFAVQRAFELMTKGRPLALVFEDVQWAGRSTLDLLEFLVRSAGSAPMLIVASVREGERGDSAAVQLLRRARPEGFTHVPVGGLGVEDVRALIASAASDAHAPDAEALYTASEGNALFATELLREALGSGAERSSPSRTLAQTVTSRLSRLSPRAKTLIDAAAIAGTGFDAEVVRAACGWNYAQLYEALDELFDGALLRESHERRGELRFSHQLVHAVAYDEIDAAVRRRLHRRIARILQQHDDASSRSAIARHYDAAGLRDEAVTQYVAAARHAVAVYANDEAVELASRGLALSTSAEQRFDLFAVRERALRRLGELARCREDSASLIESARDASNPDLLGEALVRAIGVLMQLGDRDAEKTQIGELQRLARRTRSPRWRLETALARARLAINTSDYAAAEAILVRAEHDVDEVADPASALDYWLLRAQGTARRSPAEAFGFVERTRRYAGDDDEPMVRVLRAQAAVEDFAGDPVALEHTARALLERYERIGDLEGQAQAHQHLGVAAWYRCDVADAASHNATALALFERLHKPNSVASVLVNRGVAQQHLGAFEGADADYRRAEELALYVGSWEIAVLARADRASLCVARGDPQTARMLASEALHLAEQHHLSVEKHAALCYLAEAERELGDCVSAVRHLETALEYYRAADPRNVLETLVELVPAYLGAHDVASAVRAGEELLVLLEPNPMRVTFPAHAFDAAASAFTAAGDLERARALRARALETFRAICAKLPEEARAGYRSLRIHRPLVEEAVAP